MCMFTTYFWVDFIQLLQVDIMSTIMMNLIDRRLQSKICGNDTYLCEVATTWAQNVLEAYENVKAFAGLIKSDCLFKSINCNSHTN
jgi:hypothetical protein